MNKIDKIFYKADKICQFVVILLGTIVLGRCIVGIIFNI